MSSCGFPAWGNFAGWGAGRLGTVQATSPVIARASRLVAKMRKPGLERSSASASAAQASTRCSQLSNKSSARRACRKSAKVSFRGRLVCSRTFNTAATAAGNRCASPNPPSSTSQTPSGKRSKSPAATSKARRVLPVPPGPVSVTRRNWSNRARTAAISAWRPMKLLNKTGRLFGALER